MSEPTRTAPVAGSSYGHVVQRLVIEGRPFDALGAHYMAGVCTCPNGPGRDGFTIVTVPTYAGAVELHHCATCGRPTPLNRARVLGAEPYAKGDVAVFMGELVTITGAAGPTGVVRCCSMDDTDRTDLQVPMALLNMED